MDVKQAQMEKINKELNNLLAELCSWCAQIDEQWLMEQRYVDKQEVLNATYVFAHYLTRALIDNCIQKDMENEDILKEMFKVSQKIRTIVYKSTGFDLKLMQKWSKK